jgi:hypothetical protein
MVNQYFSGLSYLNSYDVNKFSYVSVMYLEIQISKYTHIYFVDLLFHYIMFLIIS